MSRALPITDEDITDVVRLLGEVAGMTEPLADRRRRIMEGLVALTGSDTWMWVASRGLEDGRGGPFYLLDGGWVDDAQRTAVWHANAQPEVMASLGTGIDFRRHETFAYDAGHAGWGDGAIFRQYIEPTGLHHLLFSIYPLDRACTSGIGVHRRAGRPPYGTRDRALIHLVVSQLDWLHRAGTDVPANTDALRELTPRQREILVHLLGGDSRKQVATKLGLSPFTVHDHVKGIYKCLGVSSNTELLARFLPAGGR